MKYLFLFILSISLASCWPTSVSLIDSGSMPPEWKTFSVKTLSSSAANAPNNYASNLTEKVKDGVQNNTRLLLDTKSGGGQVVIEGEVVDYKTTPLAIQQGDVAAKNRLEITANFTIYINAPKEDKMILTSKQFYDFDASTDFTSNEASFAEEVNKKIVQDVINKLLSNW